MVVKMDMMWPFYIICHVNIYLNLFVMYVMTYVRKFFITFGLPMLCMAPKNKFGRHRISDQKFSVANFRSPQSITKILFSMPEKVLNLHQFLFVV